MNCPCGSNEEYSSCCEVPTEGSTPEDIKQLVRRSIVRGFKNAGDVRGELCLYASLIAKELLALHNIRSYVVAGSARWNYPIFYEWRPDGREFHAWLITQYGEYVDLTIDDIQNRRDFEETNVFRETGYSIDPPLWCWSKRLVDRKYDAVDLGATSLEIDENGYSILRTAVHNVYNNLPK
ncbi:hypothetical protein A8990_114110 [Paenibacillus taihuensis]|uniref:SEC-C motif-containing protein n=1 Tax=Paenibacillus taihuensis TaxID=1156355 RepID=A0A3D9S6Y7_9BACL|nr:hypothetical protein [Paenibacillus taihuensis]REE84575.1 hypothetical protein A8990_114110 [Paenibacillus taihuensis]